jgi:hypothetical protein
MNIAEERMTLMDKRRENKTAYTRPDYPVQNWAR